MAQPVVMPKLGQTVEESTIVSWHKKEGDSVNKGDVLFEIETDKAVLEAESFFEGTLLKILVQEGETVPVSSVVAYIGKPGEKVPEAPPVQAPQATPAGKDEAPSPPRRATAPAPVPRPTQPRVEKPAAPDESTERLRISPRARRLAKQCAIDPAGISGSGRAGRIIERDIRQYLKEQGYERLRITPAAKELAIRESVDILRAKGTGEGGRIRTEDVRRLIAERPKPMTKMRQVIARRLSQSFTTTPHFYVSLAVDMTDLLDFRKQLKKRGTNYKVTDFIMEAVILSLLEYPPLNSVTDGTTVSWHAGVQLGMAVGLDEGLVVPVIANAEELTMGQLHEQAQHFASRAREGKLLPDEMSGSTFTVSNMGMMNVDSFSAIINPGESAILAVASTRKTPVVRRERLVIRSIMNMTLSADHRIVDGATGAAFMNAIKHKLEDMELWKRLT